MNEQMLWVPVAETGGDYYPGQYPSLSHPVHATFGGGPLVRVVERGRGGAMLLVAVQQTGAGGESIPNDGLWYVR